METKLYSVGHSNKKANDLITLLKRFKIDVLADARTMPFSKYNPQFNRFDIAKLLDSSGIKYLYRGKNIGGKGVNEREDEALDELVKMAKEGKKVAIMCSEGNFRDCHRFTKLAPKLLKKGVDTIHINWDNSSQSHAEFENEESSANKQFEMF